MDVVKPNPTEFPPQIPWMIRSLLHAGGKPEKELTVRQANAFDAAEINGIEWLLLQGVTLEVTKVEVRRWTNGLRAAS